MMVDTAHGIDVVDETDVEGKLALTANRSTMQRKQLRLLGLNVVSHAAA
ncbi:hypothetical protein [Pigmentiphaga sp. H8]|nr:hypothetical protein [Pigmentiphaga sp. H8]